MFAFRHALASVRLAPGGLHPRAGARASEADELASRLRIWAEMRLTTSSTGISWSRPGSPACAARSAGAFEHFEAALAGRSAAVTPLPRAGQRAYGEFWLARQQTDVGAGFPARGPYGTGNGARCQSGGLEHRHGDRSGRTPAG